MPIENIPISNDNSALDLFVYDFKTPMTKSKEFNTNMFSFFTVGKASPFATHDRRKKEQSLLIKRK
jgi:hypothetical protein